MSPTRSRARADCEPRLVVRRARPEDRDPILKMSEKIWGGTDYLPLVWDAWLADTKGLLLTATLDGRPVGVSKISVLSPGEIWLEGLRLDPDLQGRGLVRQINRAAFREVARFKPRSVRYSTGAGNAASRHLGEARGFWLVARTRWMWGRALPRHTTSGRAARPDEIDAVRAYVSNSACYKATSGLYASGWKFPELNARRLRRLLKAGRVLVWPGRGKIRGAAIYDIGEIDNDVCLGFLDGSPEAMRALARDVLGEAARLDRKDSSAMLPAGRPAEAARSGGYDVIIPADAVVYELGPRGFGNDDRQDFEDMLWRAYRLSEPDLADAVADTLVEAARRPVARENVRDFVLRHILPDSRRQTTGVLEDVSFKLGSWALRAVLRGIVDRFMDRYGIGGDAIKATSRTLSFRCGGRRVATVSVRRDAVTLTLGPGFGACFDADAPFDVDEVEFLGSSLDSRTGRYEAMRMRLTEERQVPEAARAIDMIMRSAARRR